MSGIDPHLGQVSDIFPYAALAVAEKEDKLFSDVFAYCHSREVRATTFLIHGQAESASGELVSGRYFQALGVVPVAGRLITADDDRVGAPSVVVTSSGFAERHFGSANAATSQSVLLNNVPFTVVGVAPAEFFGVDPESPRLLCASAHQCAAGSIRPVRVQAHRTISIKIITGFKSWLDCGRA